VQLVKVADGYHVWSQRYDRTLEDIFAVQDDIAQSVVKELRTTLLGEAAVGNDAGDVTAQLAVAVKGRAHDAEAHQLYLQARYFIERENREDTTKAFRYLERALERDRGFALAWAELARAHMSAAGHEWTPPATAFECARQAVASALASEPELAEAHTALGWIQMMYDWDWLGAEASYVRALALAPGNAAVLRRAGVLHLLLGRYDVGVGLFRRAIEKDPLSGATYSNLGIAYYALDRLEEAAEACRKALELTPQQVYPRATLALVLLGQRRLDEALAEASRLEPEEPMRVWLIAMIHHAGGRRAEAEEALAQLVTRHATTSAYRIAQVHAARGDNDLAFEWLERAFAQHDAGLAHARIIPLLRNLHVDPRWQTFMRKMGFPD
jgi:serine/threonine-protein kinase